MHEDDDNLPPKPRWIGWAIIIGMALAALGVLNIGWRIFQGPPTPESSAAAVQVESPVQRGQRLVAASDCMRCHGMERYFVGPGFAAIAARHAGQPGAQALLARKIREGSVGDWGRVIMPRHPHINEAQALDMAAWVLSLPPVQVS